MDGRHRAAAPPSESSGVFAIGTRVHVDECMDCLLMEHTALTHEKNRTDFARRQCPCACCTCSISTGVYGVHHIPIIVQKSLLKSPNYSYPPYWSHPGGKRACTIMHTVDFLRPKIGNCTFMGCIKFLEKILGGLSRKASPAGD